MNLNDIVINEVKHITVTLNVKSIRYKQKFTFLKQSVNQVCKFI